MLKETKELIDDIMMVKKNQMYILNVKVYLYKQFLKVLITLNYTIIIKT